MIGSCILTLEHQSLSTPQLSISFLISNIPEKGYNFVI
jgi:hypothetical protein